VTAVTAAGATSPTFTLVLTVDSSLDRGGVLLEYGRD